MRRTHALLLSCSLAFAAGACATKTTTTQQTDATQTSTTSQTTATQTAAQQPATTQTADGSQQSDAPQTSASAQNGAQPPSTASAQASGAQGTAANGAKSDACALITKTEFETVQGDPLKEQKSSEVAQGGFSVSQCFYQANTFAKSVSLTVTRSNNPAHDELREFWREKFHRETEERERVREEKSGARVEKEKGERAGKERGRGREEEEGEGSPATKISGVGDEAFWVGNRALGALYVLKKNSFVRISIGGSEDAETKQRKARLLAQKAIQRL